MSNPKAVRSVGAGMEFDTLTHYVRAATWLNSWLAGEVSADATIDATRHSFATISEPGDAVETTPHAALSWLGTRGATPGSGATLRPVWPIPGDASGLAGHNYVIREAVGRGCVFYLDRSSLALTPQGAAKWVSWQLSPTATQSPPATPQRPETARSELRLTLLEALQDLPHHDHDSGDAAERAVATIRSNIARCELPVVISNERREIITTALFVIGACGWRIAQSRTNLTLVDVPQLRELERTARQCLSAACWNG